MSRPVSRLLLVACLTLVAVPGRAGVVQVADGVARIVCSDQDGSAHPGKLVFDQTLQLDDAGAEPGFLALYDSSQEGAPMPGSFKVKISRYNRRGKPKKVTSVATTTDPVTGQAAAAGAKKVELASGDRLRWRFEFDDFEPLRRGKCFSIQAVVTRSAE